jgi:hypothetical protein
MIDIIRRELIYFFFYFEIQFDQIAKYWAFGIFLAQLSSYARFNPDIR